MVEVIVTGTQDGKSVRFSTKALLKDHEEGNALIPRLWARMRIDALFEQGGPAAHEEIHALSEQYNLITPYTSSLLSESERRPQPVQGRPPLPNSRQ